MIKNLDQFLTIAVSIFMLFASIRILIGAIFSFEKKSSLYRSYQYLVNYLDDEDK